MALAAPAGAGAGPGEEEWTERARHVAPEVRRAAAWFASVAAAYVLK